MRISRTPMLLVAGLLGLAGGYSMFIAEKSDSPAATAHSSSQSTIGQSATKPTGDIRANEPTTLVAPLTSDEARSSATPARDAIESNASKIATVSPIDPRSMIQTAEEAVLKIYDEGVIVRTTPSWWGHRNIYRDINAIDSGAVVTDIACSEAVCRVDIFYADPATRKDFIDKATRHPSFSERAWFRQSPDDPYGIVAYLMPPQSSQLATATTEIHAMLDNTREEAQQPPAPSSDSISE